MKLTEKFSPAQLRTPSWELYDQCSESIGVILDNRFKDPHITVYEHVRHSPSEVFWHRDDDFGDLPPKANIGETDLVREELDLLGALQTPEIGRRLNIVGDVGVGKTTFIKHLAAMHLATPEFLATSQIYIDFSDFNASLEDPIVDIRHKFVDTVWGVLEKLFTEEECLAADDKVFDTADIFAPSRAILKRLPVASRPQYIAEQMQEMLRTKSVKFSIDRINVFSEGNPNRLLLVVDNIDHLPETVLKALSAFLLQVQLRAAPMLIVCMRDHTYMAGFSSYREDKTVLAWHLRLKPPNLRRMLDRRVDHFFPSEKAGKEQVVTAGAGILKIDRAMSKVCRSLLRSPFSDQDTYEFICKYTNYNLRDLFANLQRIVGFSGYRSHDKEFFFQEEPRVVVGVDECLIALALGDSMMFFPDHSPVFNPYSAGQDTNPLDRIVAGRMLQLLDHRIDWMRYEDLKRQLVEWGYSAAAVRAQLKAMISKDIVWTSTGAPSNFSDASAVRLSYRGQLYANKILRRTVFNYLMSFDVDATSEAHPVFRHHKSEFRRELEDFSNFSAKMESEVIAYRVLGVAELIYEAEAVEVRQLMKSKEMDGFRHAVSPRSLSMGIMDGLTKFLQKSNEADGNGWRFMPPTTATLKVVSEASEKYRRAFSDIYKTVVQA